MIDWKELINAKVKRLQELKEHPEWQYRHRFWGVVPLIPEWQKAKNAAACDRKIQFVKTEGEKRGIAILAKAKERGYLLHPRRITTRGVVSLVGKRGPLHLYGFLDPIGKLMLNKQSRSDHKAMDKNLNVLTINFMRKNMVVHDSFLKAVLGK